MDQYINAASLENHILKRVYKSVQPQETLEWVTAGRGGGGGVPPRGQVMYREVFHPAVVPQPHFILYLLKRRLP